MSKKIWKWILTEASDEEIVKLIEKYNIQIPGTRKSLIPKHMKMFRPKMINQLLQPKYLLKISSYYKSKTIKALSKDTITFIFEKEVPDIISRILEDNWSYTDIFVILLTSREAEHQEKAEHIFQTLYRKGDNETEIVIDDNEEEDTSTENENENATASDETVQEITNLKKQLIAFEQRMSQLEQQLKSDQEKHDNAQKNWDIAKENYKNRIQELKQEVNGKKHALEAKDGQIIQLQNELNQKNEEVKENATKMKTQQSKISELEDVIGELKGLLMVSSTKEIASSNEVKQDARNSYQRTIHIIGNPKNKRVFNNSSYSINIIETSEIAEYIENDRWNDVQECWLLTYVVPQGKSNRIRKTIPCEKLIEFSDFSQLDEFMNKRST